MPNKMSDPRVSGFRDANQRRPRTEFKNGFKVAEMQAFDPKEPMSQQDQYHVYTGAGFNASNTKHHHEYGDVTIFYSETSATNFHGDSNKGRRYLIIADQWTGKRIQVFLPDIEKDNPEKPSVGDKLYDNKGNEAEIVEVYDTTIACIVHDRDGAVKLPYYLSEIYFDTEKQRWTVTTDDDGLI